jgi:uncharacterized protein with HEPN domain
MLDYARRAVQLGSGKTATEIADDELLSLALVRVMEVIGEAAARVSDATRLRYPTIPWRSVIDLPNRLIHGYDTVDFEVVRQILDDDFPPLITQLGRILQGVE